MLMKTIYLIYLFAIQNEGTQLNLALNKRAYLSSVSNESHAKYAVDGNAFETFAQASNIEDSGWFVVDLGRPYRVESIMYHRPDCSNCDPDFLGNNNVIVGLSNNFDPRINKTINRDYKLCAQYHGSLPPGVKVGLECQDKNAYSRYVIVRQVKKPFLTISELMVMGEYINYVGCFTRLVNSETVGLNLSLENCINKCENLNYYYAGIEVTRCFCGNETKNYSPLSECNVLCPGDVDYCGRLNKMSVYEVFPLKLLKNIQRRIPGFIQYPKLEDGGSSFFRSNHHCKDGVDLDLDKICGNKQCEDGWTGKDCSVRDCSVNNGDCGQHVCQTLHGTTGVFSECICSEGFDKNFWWDYCHEDLSLTGVSSKAGLDQTIIIVIVASLILFALIIVGFAFIYFKMSNKIRTIQTDVTSQNTKDDGVNPDPNRLSSFYDEINPVEEMSVFKSEEGYATLAENTKDQSQKKMSNTYSVLQPVPAPRVAISNTGARVTYLEPVLENYLDNYSNLPLPN